MTVTLELTPQQQAWLEAQVEAGVFPSVEDGVRIAVADLMMIAQDDLGWAKPYVDVARDSISEGRSVSGAVFLEKLNERISQSR